MHSYYYLPGKRRRKTSVRVKRPARIRKNTSKKFRYAYPRKRIKKIITSKKPRFHPLLNQFLETLHENRSGDGVIESPANVWNKMSFLRSQNSAGLGSSSSSHFVSPPSVDGLSISAAPENKSYSEYLEEHRQRQAEITQQRQNEKWLQMQQRENEKILRHQQREEERKRKLTERQQMKEYNRALKEQERIQRQTAAAQQHQNFQNLFYQRMEALNTPILPVVEQEDVEMM